MPRGAHTAKAEKEVGEAQVPQASGERVAGRRGGCPERTLPLGPPPPPLRGRPQGVVRSCLDPLGLCEWSRRDS